MDRKRTTLGVLGYGLLLVPLLFLAVFYFYPLASIFGLSLFPDGRPDLSGFADLVTSGYYRRTLAFTLYQATLSTVLTIGLALPGAFVFTRYDFPGKSLLVSLATLPFVLPTVVVAAAFNALVGSGGVLNNWLMMFLSLEAPPIQLERTLALILIAHIFYNYAVALRIIASYWQNQSLHMEEAAQVLGCRGWRLWTEIRLPTLLPAITAAAVLVFVFTFTSFGVILILGGLRYATLEIEIYRQAINLFDLPTAAALSLVQIGVMLLMMVFYTRLQRRMSTDYRRTSEVAQRPVGVRQYTVVSFNLLLMVVLLFAPLLALVVRSFVGVDTGFALTHYQLLGESQRGSVLFVPPYIAIWNSLRFAVITTGISMVLGVIAAYLLSDRDSYATRLLDPLFMLPLATSAVTLGFGFIIALDQPPLNLRASWVLIPLAHTLVAMPFVVRSVLPALRGIPQSVREAARVLGASPFQVLRFIDVPLISRGLVVGATFAFTVSMGEFGASLFIARPDTPTMPIVIFRLLGQPGVTNYGQAMAMSVLLMLVCAVSFVTIERVRSGSIGEF